MPSEIEEMGMLIVEPERNTALPEEIAPIVGRVVHATADFSFAQSLRFTDGVVPLMRRMLEGGATIVTDTNRALSGISRPTLRRLGVRAVCFMADEDVMREARSRGETRSRVSMERALRLKGPKLIVCGNAPTFLYPLLEAGARDVAVVAVPVGFAHVSETKERLLESGVPCIVSAGRHGGSNAAAAVVNALMCGIEGIGPFG